MITIDPISLIYIFIVACYFLLFPAFFFSKKKSNRVFSFLLICIAMYTAAAVYYRTGLYLRYPHFIMVNNCVSFLFGPVFYIYIEALTGRLRGRGIRPYLYFTPFVIVTIVLIPFFLQTGDYKISFMARWAARDLPVYVYGFNAFLSASIIVFNGYCLIISLRVIRNYQNAIQNRYSNIDSISLSWVKNLIFFSFIFFFIAMIMAVFVYVFQMNLRTFLTIVILISTVFMYILILRSLLQPEILFNQTESSNESYDHNNDGFERKKYARSSLTLAEMEQYVSSLYELMDRKKLFSDDTITLARLADEMMISHNHLSRVINEKIGLNFYDFINKYRVEEVKKFMDSDEKGNMNLLQIAYECGFRSKATFNRAFRKYANMSPSDYKKGYSN
jgi:AraC-like DNA-binding protein